MFLDAQAPAPGGFWPWLWPTLLLVAWSIFSLVGLGRIVAWLGKKARATTQLDETIFRRAGVALAAVSFLGGVFVWGRFAPLPVEVQSFLTDGFEPWFWPTLGFVLWLTIIFFFVRRLLDWAARRTEATATGFDDALLMALRAPLYVVSVIIGLNMWAALVPLPAQIPAWITAGTKATAIVVVALFADGFVHNWLLLREKSSNVLATSGAVIRTGLKILVYTVAALMVLGTLDVDVTPIIASLGIGSLAVGLALQKTLEDFLAGLLIAADQPITVGDFVQIEPGVAGTVVSVGWRTVRLQTLDDMHVIVPNAKLAQATLVNRSRPRRPVSFLVDVGVEYASDLDRAAEVTTAVAEQVQAQHPSSAEHFRPRLVVARLGSSGVEIQVWLRAVDWQSHFTLRDAFIRALHRRFRVEGLKFAFPSRTLYVPDAVPVRMADPGAPDRISESRDE